MRLSHVGQAMSPHGFVTRAVAAGPFGQIVVDPGAACELAMQKGNALAIKLLASRAAGVFLEGAREVGPGTVSGIILKGRADALLKLAERRGPDTATPSTMWNEGERNFICIEVRSAHTASFGARSRGLLIDVADAIQTALQSPDPGEFKPEPIGPGQTRVSTATVAIAIAGILAVGGGLAYVIGRRR